MKYSYNWLKELSGTKKTAEEIAELFLTHSFEVEGIEDLSKNFDKVVVGEVLSVEKHPDADRLNVSKVNVGKNNGGELQIVCGAPNLKVGQKVAVALVGAVLPDNGKGFNIKKSKIRGVESCGMICAEDELGLGDDHEGILILDDTAVVGQDFAEYMNLKDKILDIDILPNRGHDCLGYNGVARELNALENLEFQNSKFDLNSNDIISDNNEQNSIEDQLKVEIDTKNCSRYVAIKIKNIQIKSSPIWMQARLKVSGLKPINNIVDITNYVMLKTGQPLHAFDSKLAEKITVRQAKDGEKIKLLDAQELELIKDDIVITDGESPIALAGVMGGLESGIQDNTTEIILEVANFNAASIRLTARRYNLQTDAAYRFERDIDPNFIDIAVMRTVELIKELAGGEVMTMNDIYPDIVKSWVINLDTVYVENLLGVKISNEEIIDILKRLGIEKKENQKEEDKSSNKISFIIPTRRRDLRTQEDLIEEVGRIYGYNKIIPQPLLETIEVPHKNKQRFFERSIKDILTQNGFDETRSYSFYSKKSAEVLGLNSKKHLALLNPMNPDQAFVRQTLIDGMLKACKKSLSYYKDVYLFDIGKTYILQGDEKKTKENLILGMAVANQGNAGEQFFYLKESLENLFQKINLNKWFYDDDFSKNKNIEEFHLSRRALIKTENGKILGVIGEMNKRIIKHFGIKNVRVAVAEIDINILLNELSRECEYDTLAKFPTIERDLSMVVGKRTRVIDVENLLYLSGGKLIENVEMFDLYVNPKTEERSMAFHITFSDSERTLKTKEVDEQIEKMITAIEKEPNVEVKK